MRRLFGFVVWFTWISYVVAIFYPDPSSDTETFSVKNFICSNFDRAMMMNESNSDELPFDYDGVIDIVDTVIDDKHYRWVEYLDTDAFDPDNIGIHDNFIMLFLDDLTFRYISDNEDCVIYAEDIFEARDCFNSMFSILHDADRDIYRLILK